MPTYKISESLDAWLRRNDRGISSNTIVEHLTGFPALGSWEKSHPHDPADLGRCLRLLVAAPELGPLFWGMRTCSHVWAALVDRWDELTRLYLEEKANSEGHRGQTYDLMRDLIDPLEASASPPIAEIRRQIAAGEVVRMKIPAEGVSKEVLEALGAKVMQSNKG